MCHGADPLAADAQRERTIRRAGFAAAAVQRVVVAVAEQLLRQIAVVLEGVGLHEQRRIGRIPRAVQVLPLPREAGHHLEVVRHVLRERRFPRVDDHLRPGGVGLLRDDALVRIDAAEADERLERRRRVDAVDVDLAEVVVEAAVRQRRADAHLPLQLPAVAHRVLVDVRLVQVLVEQQVRIDAARRRRDHGAAACRPA